MGKRLLIVWHGRTGGTEQLVQAALRGAAAFAPAVRALAMRAQEAGPDELLQADALLFAAPENLAALSGAMKECLDRCYYPLLDRCLGKPYASLICAGSDGEGAQRQLERIATGWRLKRVAAPLIVRTGAQSPESILAVKRIAAEELARAEELGATLAAGLEQALW